MLICAQNGGSQKSRPDFNHIFLWTHQQTTQFQTAARCGGNAMIGRTANNQIDDVRCMGHSACSGEADGCASNVPSLIAGGGLVVALGTTASPAALPFFDPHREVASAQLIDGWGHKQPLLNLAFLRMGTPRLEGAVQITCRSGKVVEGGYVTPGVRTWQKMGEADCHP